MLANNHSSTDNNDDDDDDKWVDTSNDEYYFGVRIYDQIIEPEPTTGIGAVYLGRVHFLRRVEEMKSLGIGAVLSVIGQKLPEELNKDAFAHLYLKFEDDSDEQLCDKFETICAFLEEQRTKTNVYVHCQMGISRSSTALCAYLMKHNNMDLDSALDFIRQKRSCVAPNQGFLQQLRAYEKIIEHE